MGYTALQNTPIVIDLTVACNTTGWTVNGAIASHESCNAGAIVLNTYALIPGATYQISYAVLTISGGYVQVVAGTTAGVSRTTAGLFVETIVANGTVLTFYSNANCTIKAFNIRNTVTSTSNTKTDTLVFDVLNKKWTFRTISPDCGFSIYVDMLTMYQGNLYLHQNGSDDRNVFYGVPYQSIMQIASAIEPTISKTYQSLSIQSNQLIVTGNNGISTSLGQVSELAEIDFVKDILTDGTSTVAVETIEGIYSANFLRDKNDDLLNGTVLRGNYMLLTLQSTVNGPLRLFTVNIMAKYSAIGAR